MLKTLPCLSAILLLGGLTAPAREIPAADLAAFDEAVRAARPGDAIVLRAGEWRDVELRFKGAGTPEAPITLKAATPGQTILTGKARLRIGGNYLVVEGLHFRDPEAAPGDVIEFRLTSKFPAHHCRLTQTAVTLAPGTGKKDDPENRWIGLYGSDHRVDHCLVQGKVNPGATVVVWLGAGNEGGHRLEANYFGPREPLGKNGGETIRVGDSATSMQTAHCIVDRNLFERCDGELECISNKSCGNIYRENSFVDVSGTLTLRHGNGCLVENNVFLGSKAKGAGGIRIIGEDHTVRGNYLEGLTGTEARAGLCFMAGIPNSPLNGYFQVKRAHLEDNTLVNCNTPILIGLSDRQDATLPPEETVFSRNRIVAPKRTVVLARCSLAGIRWEANSFFGKELGLPPTAGIEWQEPQTTARQALERSQAGPQWYGK